MKGAVIKFEGNYKQYEFKTDLDLKKGDLVVCDTSIGYSVGEVINLLEEITNKATKWLVCKVDLENHKARLVKEAKLKDLKAKMEKRRKQLQDIQVYELLAKDDPEMASLLVEFQQIN